MPTLRKKQAKSSAQAEPEVAFRHSGAGSEIQSDRQLDPGIPRNPTIAVGPAAAIFEAEDMFPALWRLTRLTFRFPCPEGDSLQF